MGNGSSRNSEDMYENEVNLLQFKMHRIVGKGSFGKVRIVERGVTGKKYALKYISKDQVIKMDAVKNILRERQILESVDHAFVVNMRFAFQDDDYMYMCMDPMMGGDLRFHMNRRNFNEDVVRFWIAEICSAVDHLHSLGIVHRDIKPDNILLDEKGHAHITDFNIGCKLTAEKPFLVSQSGTVAYMAPEVFKGTGYGTSVDWWSLGVLFYECIYNQRPFLTDSIPVLKRAISNQTIEYPAEVNVSPECLAVIKGFLTREPRERLGSKGGINGIRRQPFFWAAALDSQMSLDQWWHLLETKQLTPKFQPPAEAANFDATYDLEELLLEDDPLTYQSTRRRVRRLQREKERTMKEQQDKLKAEHESALATALVAAAAMEEMNRELEEAMRKTQMVIPGYSRPPSTTSTQEPKSIISKKKSRLYLFGSGDSNDSSGDGQPIVQTQPPPIPQPQPQSHHTSSQMSSRQTQFQSIPLSPVEAPNGDDLLMSPIPSLLFQSSSPESQRLYQNPPNATKPPAQTIIRDSHESTAAGHPSWNGAGISAGQGQGSGFILAQPPKPSMLSNFDTRKNEQEYRDPTLVRRRESNQLALGPEGFVRSEALMMDQLRRRESYQSTQGLEGVLFVRSESPPMMEMDNHHLSQEHAITLQQHQHPFQAAHPQMAISSPVIIPTPQDHTVSRQKHFPAQRPQPPLRRTSSQQQLGPGVGPRRPTSPFLRRAINIEAEAAAMADMTPSQRYNYQMNLIEREFTTFDYTVYESYDGLVDPVTMSVGNPPEWVRSLD
ncbi:hypothetical protein BGZ65_003694 [Modicella reniformis]|uniref:non-specific serine/threonine protein kinase n=1 Tax=Modicella reniformis TaxID=1440133 RepID=A0A9P6MHQ6_9FUNG|nr:hypothetical protein BGZ65_003694 [Modicella reniformis]